MKVQAEKQQREGGRERSGGVGDGWLWLAGWLLTAGDHSLQGSKAGQVPMLVC